MSSPPRPNWGTRLSPARKAVTVVLMQHPAAFRHEASVWFGVGAPKSTPAGFVDRLNTEINLGLADPKVMSRLADQGNSVLRFSPDQFGKLIADETEKWGKVIKFAGIKAE